MLRREAREILGLPAAYEPAELEAAFRCHARLNHPDHGGDPDVFVAVVEAHRVLTQSPSAATNVVIAAGRGRVPRLAGKLRRRFTRHPRVL